MREVAIATKNTGKVREIKALIGSEFDVFYTLQDFSEAVTVSEDSPLYVENAIKKARFIGDYFGFSTIADDSGLEVMALGGRPGVFSSRYGVNDTDRIEKLLKELEGVPWEQRQALFKTYLVFYMPDKERLYVFYGDLHGYIGFERHDESGFGFDPVFYIPEIRKYVVELDVDEKNRFSHRGKALIALKNFLRMDHSKIPEF